MQLQSGVFSLDVDSRPLLAAPEVEEGRRGGGGIGLEQVSELSLVSVAWAFSSLLLGAKHRQLHNPPPSLIFL